MQEETPIRYWLKKTCCRLGNDWMKHFAKFDTDFATLARFSKRLSLLHVRRRYLADACNAACSVCPMFPNGCGTADVSCCFGVEYPILAFTAQRGELPPPGT